MGELPFFVYGTLRRGQCNHGLVRDLLAGVRDAALAGFRLYEDGLPYLGPGDGTSVVRGDLLVPRPGDYGEVLARLDRLEGFRPPDGGLYVRRACQVRFGDESGEPWRDGEAWVYLGGEHFAYEPRLVVPGGDWAAHRAQPTGRRAG